MYLKTSKTNAIYNAAASPFFFFKRYMKIMSSIGAMFESFDLEQSSHGCIKSMSMPRNDVWEYECTDDCIGRVYLHTYRAYKGVSHDNWDFYQQQTTAPLVAYNCFRCIAAAVHLNDWSTAMHSDDLWFGQSAR